MSSKRYRSIISSLTTMFNNHGHQLPILHYRPKHLWYRLLLKHPLLFPFHRQADIDRTALGRRDLSRQALSGEVDLPRVGRIDLDHRRGSGDLKCEGGRVGDRDGGDNIVDENGGLLAVDCEERK